MGYIHIALSSHEKGDVAERRKYRGRKEDEEEKKRW
jgi:hypothetical protein